MRYSILQPEDIEEATNILAETFTRYEPMTIAVQLPSEDLRKFVKSILIKTVNQSLSIIARNIQDKTLAGLVLTYDFFSTTEEQAVSLPASFKPIGYLLGKLEDKYMELVQHQKELALHIFMICVSNKFTGRQIGQKLVQYCLENGNRKGYKTALTEATNNTSQHIFRKAGFNELYTIFYKDFLYNGIPVFADIEGDSGTILMERPSLI